METATNFLVFLLLLWPVFQVFPKFSSVTVESGLMCMLLRSGPGQCGWMEASPFSLPGFAVCVSRYFKLYKLGASHSGVRITSLAYYVSFSPCVAS